MGGELCECEAVRIDRRTRLGPFASARIAEVRSIIGGEDDVEESVASVHCAVSICEVKDKPEQV